jgi:acylpyruvate hydrolase
MKLGTIADGHGGTAAVRLDGEEVVILAHSDLGALLASTQDLGALTTIGGERRPIADITLAPLVPHPNKIICLGLNYATHIKETGRPTPQYPTLFAKYDGSLIGSRDPIVLPTVSENVDWEAEMAVVIGRPARHVGVDDALGHVAGYSIINDVTVRDWQRRTIQFLSGKTFESTTPLGPWLVTPDEVPTGGSGLPIRCLVDGEVMQESNTSDLLFDVATTIAYISEILTLLPGDVIATGTPGGVGFARDPQIFLRPGQVLTTEIEGLGTCQNPCVAETIARSPEENPSTVDAFERNPS